MICARGQRSCLVRKGTNNAKFEKFAGGSHQALWLLAGKETVTGNCKNAEDDLSNGWRCSTGEILAAHASNSSHDKVWLRGSLVGDGSRTRVSQGDSRKAVWMTLDVRLVCPLLRRDVLSLSLRACVRACVYLSLSRPRLVSVLELSR